MKATRQGGRGAGGATRSRRGRRSRCSACLGRSRGFSLVELLVVIAVTVVLTGLLFPAFRSVRENAHRLTCASNQRQIGTAIVLFAIDHRDRLPESRFAAGAFCRPREMMAATTGELMSPETQQTLSTWEGIGWLVSRDHGRYLDSVACLYCPSHRGEHVMERYLERYAVPDGKPIYTNYHYRGDRPLGAPESSSARTLFENSRAEVLVTDGLRSREDFNHRVGANVLHGDCSVSWFYDDGRRILDLLPSASSPLPIPVQIDLYRTIWDQVNKESKSDELTKQ